MPSDHYFSISHNTSISYVAKIVTTSIIECVPCACGADNVIPYESAQYSPEKKVTTSFSQKPDDIPGISRHQLILSYESEQSENRSKNKKDSKRGVENRSQ